MTAVFASLRPDWMDAASCRAEGVDPDWFFGDRNDHASRARAKAVCATCPVKAECLQFALSAPSSSFYDFGIWAGTTAGERELIRRGRRTVAS